jgi:hypothetical protein
VAGSVPPILVRSHRCSGTPPRPPGSIIGEKGNTNEKEDKEKTKRPKPRTQQRTNEMKIKLTSVYVDDQDKALYGGTGLCQEGRFQSRPVSLADRGLARGTSRH